MPPHYSHTQTGWVTIAAAIIPGLIIVPTVAALAEQTIVLGVAAIFLLIIPLFGWLTVTIDRGTLTLKFGAGLLRKSIPLSRIRSWRAVRSSAWTGWGIRIIPGGMMWNVSGLDAVELVLDNRRRFRVGTDEPEALSAALSAVLGGPRELSPEEEQLVEVSRRRIVLLVASFLLGLALVIGGLMKVQARPPVAHVTETSLRIESLFYGQDYPRAEIESVQLLERLPRIRLRANGYAAFGVLRGHFRLDELGDGKLFINSRVPPYVLVRMRQGFVIVNFEHPEQTRALYDEIVRAGVPVRNASPGMP
jgi:hypothetical protein